MSQRVEQNHEPQPDNFVIDVIDDMIDTTITLDDGSRVRILMDERHVARVVLGYRAALERLHAKNGRRRPESGK